MITYLNDDDEKIACQGCGKMKSQCTCGCRHCGGMSTPNLTINIDSNNRKGYNTLNPGNIERDTLVYPMQAQVVTNTEETIVPNVLPTSDVTHKKNVATPRIKKKRVFLPEFL